MSEQQKHIAIVSYLRSVLPTDAIIHHSRNEGNRGGKKGLVDGKRGKAMGVLPGFPDILFYLDMTGYCIEVKDEGAYLSPIQKDVHRRLEAQGIRCAVCRSIDDTRETLAKWGVRTRERAA